MYEDSLHHRCGQPAHVAFNPDSEGWFAVRSQVCQACAELERHRQQSEGSESEPGTIVSVVNELPPGAKLRPMS